MASPRIGSMRRRSRHNSFSALLGGHHRRSLSASDVLGAHRPVRTADRRATTPAPAGPGG